MDPFWECRRTPQHAVLNFHETQKARTDCRPTKHLILKAHTVCESPPTARSWSPHHHFTKSCRSHSSQGLNHRTLPGIQVCQAPQTSLPAEHCPVSRIRPVAHPGFRGPPQTPSTPSNPCRTHQSTETLRLCQPMMAPLLRLWATPCTNGHPPQSLPCLPVACPMTLYTDHRQLRGHRPWRQGGGWSPLSKLLLSHVASGHLRKTAAMNMIRFLWLERSSVGSWDLRSCPHFPFDLLYAKLSVQQTKIDRCGWKGRLAEKVSHMMLCIPLLWQPVDRHMDIWNASSVVEPMMAGFDSRVQKSKAWRVQKALNLNSFPTEHPNYHQAKSVA